MRKIVSIALVLLFVIVSVPTDVFAARPTKPGGGGTTELVGYDVSYPQCGKTLPTDHAFAVVGVNGGNAATVNSCLAQQLSWAKAASGLANQPKVQIYVNTANPGEMISQVSTWPTSNTDPSGYTPTNAYQNTCTGANDLSCSWMYGWNRAYAAANSYFKPAAQSAGISTTIGDHVWWLDVETMNTWQSGSSAALSRNVAALEGWTSFFNHNNADVGLYSTAYQWDVITGNLISVTSNLRGLPNWRPSGSTLANAKSNCTVAPLTPGGHISMTQYIKKNLDHNHSCI